MALRALSGGKPTEQRGENSVLLRARRGPIAGQPRRRANRQSDYLRVQRGKCSRPAGMEGLLSKRDKYNPCRAGKGWLRFSVAACVALSLRGNQMALRDARQFQPGDQCENSAQAQSLCGESLPTG